MTHPARFGTWPRRWAGLRGLLRHNTVVLLILVLLNAIWLPYRGLDHDACLYGVQILNRVEDGDFGDDLYLRYGSQDRYTIFSPLMTPLVRMVGLPVGFFLAYLVFNTLFLFALQRFVLALIRPRGVALAALLMLSATLIPFGGLRIFHVNENFLTPRVLANALVLLGMERLLKERYLQALGWIAGGMCLHPIMSFGGFLVWSVCLLLRVCKPRVFWAVGGLAGAAAGLILAIPAVGFRVFGVLDSEWRSLIHSANYYSFPAEWIFNDWLLIGSAITICLGTCLSRERHSSSQRFLSAVLIVAMLGLVGGFLAGALPYALLLQGQPYRAVWLLQLAAVPLGLELAYRLWHRAGFVPQIGAVALFNWLACSSFVRWLHVVLLFLAIATVLGLIYRKLRRERIAFAAIGSLIITSLAKILDHVVVLATVSAELNEKVDPLFCWRAVPVVSGPLVVVSLSVMLLSFLGKFRHRRFAVSFVTVVTAVCVQTFFFVVPESPLYARLGLKREREVAFVKEYLAAQPAAQPLTIHWPASTPRDVWFRIGAQHFFSVQQIAGNMFHRETAVEGGRRARLVSDLDMAAFQGRMPLATPWQKRSLAEIYPCDVPPRPTRDDLLRLCREPVLDFVIVRQRFDGLYEATNGEWYVYNCRRVQGAFETLSHADYAARP